MPNNVPGHPTATRPREPGLLPFVPGHERYTVPGGSALALDLHAGDRLRVTDPEGLHTGQLLAFDREGRPDPGALDRDPVAPAPATLACLDAAGEAARSLRHSLRRRGIALDGRCAAALFDGESAPGTRFETEALRDLTCLVCAAGPSLSLDGARAPATDLEVEVERARCEPPRSPALPEPLADPRLDLHVERATAIAYEIRAGEYVQIIDVAGRQCSDFTALGAAHLERQREVRLDATVTRTLVGGAYPGPGLYSRYYDEDMQPMLEVVRDTVGRHDTFGLACTARGYENKGYYGHPNCSDNLSNALAPYGVAPKRAWPAINFFFNTRIDANNLLSSDECWTRPGDYVLMRALEDLVCASTACPDDTSPINAWNPTDIHVRVYPAKHRFSRALAYRKRPEASPVLTRETAFHPRTSALTRHYSAARDYWIPASYTATGALAEYWACRERAALFDLSALRKFDVSGPDAEALLDYTLTRNVRKLAPGRVVYSAMCYPHGGMLDDGTLFRLGADNFRWTCNDDECGEWLRRQARELGLKVWVKTATDELHNLALQGPKSREILADVVWTPGAQPALDELGWFRFTLARLHDAAGCAVLVSRTGFSGELGYELWCRPEDGPAVWDAVMAAGAAHGIAPCGGQALDMLRIEAGLIVRGNEFDARTDPFAAGIGFTVALAGKHGEFVGKAALARNREHPQHALVGLRLAGRESARGGDDVYLERAAVGTVTSATRSPLLDCAIALARVNVEYAAPGTELDVGKLDGQQKRLPATVVPLPFYDPERTRIRA